MKACNAAMFSFTARPLKLQNLQMSKQREQKLGVIATHSGHNQRKKGNCFSIVSDRSAAQ